MKKTKIVPFNDDGNMLGYPCGYVTDYRELSEEFKANLSYTGFSRGRSSIKAHFEDVSSGVKYEMFMKDLDTILKDSGNVIEVLGLWTFQKRGMNFGIKLVKKL